MAELHAQLELSRCPHCKIDHPNLSMVTRFDTTDHSGNGTRFWGIYKCARCGGVIAAASRTQSGYVQEYYPKGLSVDEVIPARARAFLQQAIDSRHAPAGAVMLAASAVDAMLKAKGYLEGSLYTRIDKARDSHLITEGMAQWAHEVRLDANDQRHADEAADLPTEADAGKCIDFAIALGQFLFVLPARIERGLADASNK